MVPAGIEKLPEWALYLFYATVAIGAAVLLLRSLKIGAREVGREEATGRAITAMQSVQPGMDRLTQDTFARTIGDIQVDVKAIRAIVEEEKHDREQAERDELRSLREMARRWGKEMKPRDGPPD